MFSELIRFTEYLVGKTFQFQGFARTHFDFQNLNTVDKIVAFSNSFPKVMRIFVDFLENFRLYHFEIEK